MFLCVGLSLVIQCLGWTFWLLCISQKVRFDLNILKKLKLKQTNKTWLTHLKYQERDLSGIPNQKNKKFKKENTESQTVTSFSLYKMYTKCCPSVADTFVHKYVVCDINKLCYVIKFAIYTLLLVAVMNICKFTSLPWLFF